MNPFLQVIVPVYRTLDAGLAVCIKSVCRLRKSGKRDKRKGMVLGLLSIFLTYYLYQTLTMPVRFLFINKNVDTKCIIPDLDPFDKSIMKYVWSPDPIQCDPRPNLLYVNDAGELVFNKSAKTFYGSDQYKCSYMSLNRRPDNDYKVTFGEDTYFEPPVKIRSDFFRVRCRNPSNEIVYDRLYESIFYEKIKSTKTVENENSALDHYSVIMFGIDSTSRLSAVRKLPKTMQYLAKELDALVFKGYMKVGDNTFPNVVPILTGKRPWTADLPGEYKGSTIDHFPFIWNNFSAAHYATFFAEDYPDIATFNTEASGFRVQPTDHYMRPWMLGMKEMAFASTVLKSVLLPLEYSNINLKKTSSLCLDDKPIHKHLINYYKRFVMSYRKQLKFSFSWLVQICHEFINYLELGDQDFHDFFKFLNDDGHLENAFLIFFSDHGSRIDDIRNTFVGRIEERMPLLSIVPPKSFGKKYPDLVNVLKQNTDRLTSNFDLHQTLTDILHSNFDSEQEKLKFTQGRGISLFKTIPEERSCADASIPEHFCACYGTKPVNPTERIIAQATDVALSHLNHLLRKYKDICAELSLFKIHEAQEISLGLSAQGEEENRWTVYKFFSKPEAEKHKRFLVIFETQPGGAMFEATIDFHTENGMQILDDISRTNKYGNTSICVPEKPLRRYCYCKVLLDKV